MSRRAVSAKRDLALFCSWVAVLFLCLVLGPIARPWFDDGPGELAAGLMVLTGAVALAGAALLWLRLPRERRGRAGWGLLAIALGMGLLAWLQPLLIERSHIIMYGVLGVLSWRLSGHRFESWTRLIGAGLLAGGLGLLDEVGQGLHPDRFFDWRDVGTNAAAGVLGVLAAWLLQPGKKRRPQPEAPDGLLGAGLNAQHPLNES